jgi:hypothetical protein
VTADLVCHLYLLPRPIWAILLTPISAMIPRQVLVVEQPPPAEDREDVWQVAPRAQPDPLAVEIVAFLRQLGSIAQLTNLTGPFAIHV